MLVAVSSVKLRLRGIEETSFSPDLEEVGEVVELVGLVGLVGLAEEEVTLLLLLLLVSSAPPRVRALAGRRSLIIGIIVSKLLD